jgi:hypothetical protein
MVNISTKKKAVPKLLNIPLSEVHFITGKYEVAFMWNSLMKLVFPNI